MYTILAPISTLAIHPSPTYTAFLRWWLGHPFNSETVIRTNTYTKYTEVFSHLDKTHGAVYNLTASARCLHPNSGEEAKNHWPHPSLWKSGVFTGEQAAVTWPIVHFTDNLTRRQLCSHSICTYPSATCAVKGLSFSSVIQTSALQQSAGFHSTPALCFMSGNCMQGLHVNHCHSTHWK